MVSRIDIIFGAGVLEGVRQDSFASGQAFFDLLGCRADISGRGEVRAIIGEYGMDFVGHGRDQGSQEIGGDGARRLLMQFGEGELGCAVDRHEEIELALFGSHLGNVDVKIADGVLFGL